MVAIDDCMKRAPTKKAFVEMMERKGYAVKWTDTRQSTTYTCPNNKSCRDILLHNPRYLKEKMEREFELRRIETEKRQLAARENTTGTDAPTAELLSAPDRELGRDTTANPLHTATAPQSKGAERSDTSQAEPTTRQDGFTGNTASGQGDGTDIITGWEAEREIFFHPEMALAEIATQPDVAVGVPDIGGVMGSVVQLGKSVERLGGTVPMSDATTKPLHSDRKNKKLGIGQKEDDRSRHDFEMTM